MIFKWDILVCLTVIYLRSTDGNYICLIGNDAPSPLSFDTITTCGVHEICSLEQYVTPGGLVRYNAGCKDVQHCGESTAQDPNLSVCSQCCSGDLCSVSLCGQQGYDTSASPVCYDCLYAVDQPDLCNKIKHCGSNEVCGTYVDADGKYLSQCMDQQQCNYHQTHSTCASCCNNNICNTNCTKTNYAIGPQCADEPNCLTLQTTFHNNNRNLCDVELMKHFCNETCGLCPTTTPMPTTHQPCHPNPCVNGVCTITGTNTHTCTCDVGYIGDTCDVADPCRHRPCNHGHCTNLQNAAFKCNCDAGYTGLICDTVFTTCSSQPCGPPTHGTCKVQGSSYTCNCNIGFAGDHCETELVDCKDILQTNTPSATNDDVYLATFGGQVRNVRCDMHTEGGGWTFLMNRDNGKVDFVNHKDFSDYASGFGDIREDYWIGLEKMYELTHDGRRYELRIEMTDAFGALYYETYDDFSVGPPKDFVLHVTSFRGTAGDSLSRHSGFGFSTLNVDNDGNQDGSCAQYIQGAWWFHDCYDSCLTCAYMVPGKYDCRSMSWNSYKYCTALRSVRMMARPV